MTFKLIESAQQRRRSANAPHLVALVRAGARFERGVLVERDEVTDADREWSPRNRVDTPTPRSYGGEVPVVVDRSRTLLV
jgi:hypothetical protein